MRRAAAGTGRAAPAFAVRLSRASGQCRRLTTTGTEEGLEDDVNAQADRNSREDRQRDTSDRNADVVLWNERVAVQSVRQRELPGSARMGKWVARHATPSRPIVVTRRQDNYLTKADYPVRYFRSR